MLKALVFDMDGTITVLTLPLEAMRQDTKAYYLRKGLPPHLIEEADGISSSTRKAREFFLANGVRKIEWEEWEAEVDEILSGHEGFAANSAELIEGALDVVKRIRAKGLKTAILTNNGRPALDRILEQIPLADYFDVIQTRHESPRPKPFPDGIEKIVEELEVTREETVYVGDALIDAVAAARAGVEFWGVATGETSEGDLEDAGATRVFSSLNDILSAVDECTD